MEYFLLALAFLAGGAAGWYLNEESSDLESVLITDLATAKEYLQNLEATLEADLEAAEASVSGGLTAVLAAVRAELAKL